ncbi:tetratricopeptide repeat (TPR)-like superfamily protein isoform X2 [Wolffia australiana]
MAAMVLLARLTPSTETIFPKNSSSLFDLYPCLTRPRIFPYGSWPRRENSAKFLVFRDSGRKLLSGSANFARGGVGSDPEGDEEDEGKKREWEEQLRGRMKDLEEMRELERRAEEVQRRISEDETEEEKRERVRKELEKLAKEQAERRETGKLMFDLGQKAYGRGMYSKAVEFLEGALTIIPRSTLLGGEIQIWLAMAYEANNRHKDCIELYKQLEQTHPSISIRRQAAELRYILQAPKLKISRDEMVTIPLIGSSYDSFSDGHG